MNNRSFCENSKKMGGGSEGVGLGGQGGFKRKIEVIEKIHEKNWGGGESSGWGGRGGCECRIEIFVKIQKKIILGGSGGSGLGGGEVRVDVIEELKFLGKFTKKMGGGWVGGGGRVGGGSGWMRTKNFCFVSILV